MLPASSMIQHFLFSPQKYVILKKRFICTIVVSRQIHVLTDTRMLRTILGRTFMAATLQHSTLLPGNGSVCDSILELYAILEFHTQDDHYSKIYHYYSKGRLLRVSLGLHALLFLVAKIVVLYSLYYTAPSHTPTACFSTARFNIEFIARVPQIMYTKQLLSLLD